MPSLQEILAALGEAASVGGSTFLSETSKKKERELREKQQADLMASREADRELTRAGQEQDVTLARERDALMRELDQARTRAQELERMMQGLGSAGIRVTDPTRLDRDVPTSPTTLPPVGGPAPIPFQMPTGRPPVEAFTQEAATALGTARETGKPVAGEGFIAAPREPNVNVSTGTGRGSSGVSSILSTYSRARQNYIDDTISNLLRSADQVFDFEAMRPEDVAELREELGREFDASPEAARLLQALPPEIRGAQQPGGNRGGEGGEPPPGSTALTQAEVEEFRRDLMAGDLTAEKIVQIMGEDALSQISPEAYQQWIQTRYR